MNEPEPQKFAHGCQACMCCGAESMFGNPRCADCVTRGDTIIDGRRLNLLHPTPEDIEHMERDRQRHLRRVHVLCDCAPGNQCDYLYSYDPTVEAAPTPWELQDLREIHRNGQRHTGPVSE